MSRSSRPLADLLRAFSAAGCAGLVLALTLFAASPLAHDWVHSAGKQHTCHEHPDRAPTPANGAHDCAVVLFASGVDLPVEPLALRPPEQVAQTVSAAAAAEVYLVSPRYLRHPERGPPGLS